MSRFEEKTNENVPEKPPILRQPTVEDAAGIWRLVADSGVLEPNSPYSYLILCKHFAETCVVAEHEGKIVGFVTAYRPPVSPNVVFVWQIGVDQSMRGKGLGLAILESLLHREACRDVSFLDATVTPSNTPSQALFRGLARKLSAQCVEKPCFPEHLFPAGEHEAEDLFHIGPFSLARRD